MSEPTHNAGEIKLNPCKCGGNVGLLNDQAQTRFRVVCPCGNGVEGIWFKSEFEARVAWNASNPPYTPNAGEKCPTCGNPLRRVTKSAMSPLNYDQFDSVRAGDWYCETCPSNNRGNTNFKYFWNRELTGHGTGLKPAVESPAADVKDREVEDKTKDWVNKLADELVRKYPQLLFISRENCVEPLAAFILLQIANSANDLTTKLAAFKEENDRLWSYKATAQDWSNKQDETITTLRAENQGLEAIIKSKQTSITDLASHVRSKVKEVDRLREDNKRLDWLEEQFGCGLINDDAGHWAISWEGTQSVPDNPPQDVQTVFFIEQKDWNKSVREAIDKAKEALKPTPEGE